ncbi:MAG: peptidase S16, lon-like protein [Piscirickettsiaceae bacterium]|nr:MAG: peptidase S16, lon-like protein [Piscirickettsiaceae bacterium]
MRMLTNDVPIFPLTSVLFPDGLLPLRIFETRYLDMVSYCLKNDVPFGVCLIIEGKEVGKSASCYPVGTLAKIVDWAQGSDGILGIEVIGCQRFKMVDSEVSSQQLITATVQIFDEAPVVDVPTELNDLVDMLKRSLKKFQPHAAFEEHQFNNANWVVCRLAEMLPIDNVIRQRLLEIEDPIECLNMLVALFQTK